MAEDLIRADGLSDFRYVDTPGLACPRQRCLARGEVDFSVEFSIALAIRSTKENRSRCSRGARGLLRAVWPRRHRERCRPEGQTSVQEGACGSDPHLFVTAMATHVGLDPLNDIRWVTSDVEPTELFAEGKVDAFLEFPPEAQELRTRKIGHVIVNSIHDLPWSHYYCCMLASNASFAEEHPAPPSGSLARSSKPRICAFPIRRSWRRLLVVDGYAKHDLSALQSLKEIPSATWRDFDPEDTIRFFSLRLSEAGMIKSSPQKIIATGTDWRFFNELKRELKA